MKIKKVDAAAAQQADFVVCSRWQEGMEIPPQPHTILSCALCGHPVVFSHSSPSQPKKACMECAIVEMRKQGDDFEVSVTQDTIDEVCLTQPLRKEEIKH